MKFSLFGPGVKNIISQRTIGIVEVYNLIKDAKDLKSKTTILRSISDEKLKQDYKRDNFIGVTFIGVCSQRKDNCVTEESGLICIDLDDVNELEALRKQLLEKDKHIVLLFISPSGTGLKIIYRSNPKYSFKDNYRIATHYLTNTFGVLKDMIDQNCSNKSRLCFLCNDPHVYLNSLAEEGNLDKIPLLEENINSNSQQTGLSSITQEHLVENIFESPLFEYYSARPNFEKRDSAESFVALSRICIKEVGDFSEGKRHNWCLKLAYKCNAFGMAKEKAIKHFKHYFYNHPSIKNSKQPFDEINDLLRPFDDTYEKYKAEFGMWEEKSDWVTPCLPDDIFTKLPPFIRKLTNEFPFERERDIILLGLLTLLSTCFPMVQGVYDQRRYRMNLFLFVAAPAASGKGVLSFIRMVGEKLNQSFHEKYKAELARYEQLEEDEKKDCPKPLHKKLFIAGNNTSASMISSISNNEVFGMIYENEADTITNANKGEHGHFSELLRQTFHHEAIEYERKTNKEYISIPNPALSILISGTPKQVGYFLKNMENGLTSRFMFYNYFVKGGWKNVFGERDDIDYKFRNAGIELEVVSKPYFEDYIECPSKEILFSFTHDQQKRFHDYFEAKSKNIEHIYGHDMRSAITRLGLIFFRIAMVLTITREVGDITTNKRLGSIVKCSDEDFEITSAIISSLLHHSVSIYNLLKQNSPGKASKTLKVLFMERLPDEFQRQEAMEIASYMQIKEKTAENYLAQFVKFGFLDKPGHNHYKKL